jgi:tetratricopeptide (TPR) repeat protein
MSDEPSKFLKLLDQLLPFLEAAPTWLKAWIYTLILLNFLTAAGLAIYYLISKQTAAERQSLHYFSVQRPADGENIPLGTNQSWMVIGTFPQTTDDNLAKTADVNVEVYKLPEHTPIAQSSVQKRVSTVDGIWRFESAKFAGYGSYEMVATGYFGGKSVYRPLIITCSDKSSVYRQSIEREKKFRIVANIQEIPGAASLLPQLKQQFYSLQNQFYAVYSLNAKPTPADLQKALALANEVLDMVDSALPQAASDWELQNNRAYFLKNYAQVMADLNKPEESKQALNEALLMFEAIQQQQPDDPSAWNGLGSVYLTAGQPAKALLYINRALEIQPGYEYAQHDKAVAEHMLQQLAESPAARK